MSDTQGVMHGFVNLPGVRLSFEMAGEGEPVIFLHAGLLDGRMWDKQFAFFAQRYQAIRYDMRYAGKSQTAPSTEPYSPYQDLYLFMRTLQLPRATLVGLSGGARCALDCAIAFPDIVHKLVLVSPGMSGYSFLDKWTQKRSAALRQALAHGNLADVVEVFLTMWTDGPYRTPEQVNPVVRERLRAMATHTLPLTQSAPTVKELEPPAAGRLPEVQASTLVVLGEQDTPDIHAIGRHVREQVATSALVMIPDVGHTLVMEQPVAFNVLVDRFLRG